MAKNSGICIGGKCAGEFYASDSKYLLALPRMAIDPMVNFDNAKSNRSVEVQDYTWAPFRLHGSDGNQEFGFWRHTSIKDDGAAFRELVLNYRPIDATDIVAVRRKDFA